MTQSLSDDAKEPGVALDGQRLDKWLWFARVAKTRTLSATLVTEGKVRINGAKADKPAHTLRIGDTVTIVMRQHMRILTVQGFAQRRGSAVVAGALFNDLTPVRIKADDTSGLDQPHAAREPGSGRPTKQQRREIDRFKFRST